MNHGKILISWVNYLCEEWLDRPNEGELPRFHSSVDPLINKLRRLVAEKDFVAAWHSIEQIERLYEHVPHEGKIAPRMLLECGIAAFRMGNAREAIPFLKGAATSYAQDHDKAMARWLLGCVHWYISDSINALSSWEDARRHLNEQSMKSGQGSALAQWYVDKINEMDDAIKKGSDNESPPLPVWSHKKRTTDNHHVLQSLPIVGQIPAGTPLDILPLSEDFINIDRFRINKREYHITSLISGKKVIKLPQRKHFYYILRVSGNSMNRCMPEPIESGDYVILREQHTAEPGDVVAALILKGDGEDHQATLKRYTKHDNKISLQPESDDPEFQNPVYMNRVFNELDDEFQIRGVAVAVLKPL